MNTVNQTIKRTIFDNWDLDYEATEKEAKDFLMNRYEMEEEDITDEDIQEVTNNILDQWWNDEDYMLTDYFKKFTDGFLVTASLGRWDGTFAGGDILKDWNEIKNRCLSGYDGIRLYDIDGHFFIEGIHHDGTDCFEVKALSKAGYELYDNWNYYRYGKDKSEQEIHEMLYENNLYSKLIHFAHEVYGCPKRETA